MRYKLEKWLGDLTALKRGDRRGTVNRVSGRGQQGEFGEITSKHWSKWRSAWGRIKTQAKKLKQAAGNLVLLLRGELQPCLVESKGIIQSYRREGGRQGQTVLRAHAKQPMWEHRKEGW